MVSLHDKLSRLFRVIVFDWDGTAVSGRQEEPEELIFLIDGLLRRGVWLVIVAGTNLGHIDRQLVSHLPPAARRRLIVCTNRGSEVWRFGRNGSPVRRYMRETTPGEEEALTDSAEALRDGIVRATGLDIGIVYDRLNRRKIDVIPEWKNPPKERIGELRDAVDSRLRAAGLRAGLQALGPQALHLAAKSGLAAARVTSDAKHIEIGLTDKGDSARWVERNLLQPKRIPVEDVLIAGDEFGPMAGISGSDSRMTEALPGAVIVSVGIEPSGTPPGVLHLPGGPATFRDILAGQLALVGSAGPRSAKPGWPHGLWIPTPGDGWTLVAPEYQPAPEHEVESQLALGNGFLGLRASLDRPAAASRPRAYVAGLFSKPSGDSLPALIPAPYWPELRLESGGEALSIGHGEVLELSRTLDVKRGILLTSWRHRTPSGRVLQLRTARLVSLAMRPVAAQLASIEAERPQVVALEIDAPEDGTNGSTAIAASAEVDINGMPAAPDSGRGKRRWTWLAGSQREARFSRLVAAAREGWPGGEPADAAAAALRRARALGVRRCVDAHVDAWHRRWESSDVEVKGDVRAQAGLRFALYHLNSAANPDDERVSIGARGLTGDAYMGHVFWDTDIFALPFYVHTWPQAARSLLMYRFHGLPAARARAASLGYEGALFPWESADTGEDVTPRFGVAPDGQVVPILSSRQEHHISADVAYAAWNYWANTGDSKFLLEAGAEVILEAARFWASRAAPGRDGRYHIRHVIGPDEYHEDVDDNAFTNGMARWNLDRGLETAALLRKRWPQRWACLRRGLRLDTDELHRWEEVSRGIVTGLDESTGVFEQFAGFSRLETVDLRKYEPRTAPMDILLGRERIQRSQVIKQADVLQLLALLWERFPPSVRQANFEYYEPRCGHGSSLSPPVHALVAARLGDTDRALQYFRETVDIDLDHTMGRAAGGVHIAALGGLWQAAVFGFAGVNFTRDGLRVDPHLPPEWESMRFPLQWRGRLVRVELGRKPAQAAFVLERGRPLTVRAGESSRMLRRGERWEVAS